MDMHGDGTGIRDNGRKQLALRIADHRHNGLDLGVVGECLRARQVDRGARRVDRIGALPERLQPPRHAMRVINEERRGIDDCRVTGFDIFESPDNGARKGLVDRSPLVPVVARRTVLQIVFDKQHLRPAANKTHDTRGAELAAVQADIVGAHAARQR